MSEASEDIPELVPARMVNEFCYCPRLFFLEWVDARWADNADTVDGRFQHRRVDRPSGSALPVGPTTEPWIARSLTLSSMRLGIIAKIDVVEGERDFVVPVDYKRGSPPEVPERAWEPERVQLCVQGLLLREHGYRCDGGVLYFAESRERVSVPFDAALIDRTQQVLVELRSTASCDQPPPPLVASKKCPRCSLVGICLPDEVNALAHRSEAPVRRLVPRDCASRPLYVNTQGSTIGIAGGRVEIRSKRELLDSVRLIDVSQVCVYGNVQVTTQAVREFMAREVPVCYFSYGGWFSGITEGLPGKNVELRRRQVVLAGQGGLAIARCLITGKIRNSRTFLRRNGRGDTARTLVALKDLATAAAAAVSVASLLGIEGAAARLYFGEFSSMLRPGAASFDFEGRSRRPPTDPVNCLLSYVYGLLTKDLTAVTYAIGFDPYLGFYHRPRFGRPALALDLAEEFRSIVGDSVVVNMINNGEIRDAHFVSRSGGVGLTSEGRRAVIAAYERRLDHEIRHPVFGYKVTYRRVYEVQSRVLAAHVVGELDTYSPFMTR